MSQWYILFTTAIGAGDGGGGSIAKAYWNTITMKYIHL